MDGPLPVRNLGHPSFVFVFQLLRNNRQQLLICANLPHFFEKPTPNDHQSTFRPTAKCTFEIKKISYYYCPVKLFGCIRISSNHARCSLSSIWGGLLALPHSYYLTGCPVDEDLSSTHTTILQNTHNKLFERALHAGLFSLMAAKAINAHQCIARRVRSTLWNSH